VSKLLCPPHSAESLSDDARLSVAYIGPKSRIERLIGRPKLAQRSTTSHVTWTPLSRSIGQTSTCKGRGQILAASRTAYYSANTHPSMLSTAVPPANRNYNPTLSLVSVLRHFQHKYAISCHRSRKCIT